MERHKSNHYELSNVVKKNFHFFSVFHEHDFVFTLKRSKNGKITKVNSLIHVVYKDFTYRYNHPSILTRYRNTARMWK